MIADASRLVLRPGPRLVEGLEWLAHALHPERVAEPPGGVRAQPRGWLKRSMLPDGSRKAQSRTP